jgi:hypothetical protein
LIGVISGAIEHVSARTWVTIAVTAVAAISAGIAVFAGYRGEAERERQRGGALWASLDAETAQLAVRALSESGPPLDAEETERLIQGLLRARERRR